MYRPDGWEEIKDKLVGDCPYCEEFDLDWLIENTADAMLEGLKKGIKPTLKPGRIGDAVVGYLVFIPEEKPNG